MLAERVCDRLLFDHKRRLEAARSSAQVLVKGAWFKMDQDLHGERRLSYTKTDAIELELRIAMPM